MFHHFSGQLKERGPRPPSKMVQNHGIPIEKTEGKYPRLSIKVIVLNRFYELSVQMNVSPIANTYFLVIGMVFGSLCDVWNAPDGHSLAYFFYVIKKIGCDGSRSWLFKSNAGSDEQCPARIATVKTAATCELLTQLRWGAVQPSRIVQSRSHSPDQLSGNQP